MSSPITVILAGGKGIRMRRLGEYLPKCSLIIYDQPLLVRQIEQSVQAGIQDIVLSVARKHYDLIKTIVKPIEERANIELVVDEEQRGVIPAFLSLAKKVGDRPYFFLLGDIYVEKTDFWKFAPNQAATICIDTYSPLTLAEKMNLCHLWVEQGKVVHVVEKPNAEQIKSDYFWTGYTYHADSFNRTAIELIEGGQIPSTAHFGTIYQKMVEQGASCETFMEKDAIVNLTSPDDLLIANAIEFSKITHLRPEEKAAVAKKLIAIYEKLKSTCP